MMLLLWIVIALVAVIAIMWIVGMMLPQNHSASASAHFNQPAEVVFATISNWREFKTWRTSLKSVVERQGEAGRVSWIEHTSQGTIPFEIVESHPPRRLVGKIADAKLPFGGTWTWVIEPDSTGCTLTITEDGEIYNPVYRLMARYIFGYDHTMKKLLADLTRKFGSR